MEILFISGSVHSKESPGSVLSRMIRLILASDILVAFAKNFCVMPSSFMRFLINLAGLMHRLYNRGFALAVSMPKPVPLVIVYLCGLIAGGCLQVVILPNTMNTLLVNSYYPPPTQSPFTNQSCLAQFKLRRSASRRYWVGKCSKLFPSASGSSWGVSALSKRFVLCEQQVSLCRTRRLCLDCCFFIDIILRQTIYVDYHRNLEYTAICC